MVDGRKPDWRQLCEQAANETDFSKLLDLTEQIVMLLDQHEESLQRQRELVPMPTFLSVGPLPL